MVTMTLKDGTAIDITRDSGIGDLVTLTDCLEHLTGENLKAVTFDAGEYENLALVSYEIIPLADDLSDVEYHIHLRQKDDMEVRVETLEEEMTEVQEALVEG